MITAKTWDRGNEIRPSNNAILYVSDKLNLFRNAKFQQIRFLISLMTQIVHGNWRLDATEIIEYFIAVNHSYILEPLTVSAGIVYI